MSNNKIFYANILLLLVTMSCSGNNNLSGNSDQKKDAKKDKPQDSNTSTSEDASQPQVVTGAYLACVQDTAPDTKAGETAYGCGIYDNQTQNKIDLTNRTFKLSVSDPSGQIVSSRTIDAGAASSYQQYLYSMGDSSSNKINGRLLAANGQVLFNSDIRPVRITSISDGLNLKSNYTPAEINGWCALATILPDDQLSMQMTLTKGVACGAQYLCRHNYSGTFISCIAGIASSISGNNPGICTESFIANQALFSQRCSQ